MKPMGKTRRLPRILRVAIDQGLLNAFRGEVVGKCNECGCLAIPAAGRLLSKPR